MTLHLRDGVRVEVMGDDLIVLDRTGSTLHRATGDAAEVLRLLAGGAGDVDVPARLGAAVGSLTEAGVVIATGMSRRRMLLAAGAVGGGLASFALATPAQALSVCPPGTPATNPGTFDVGGTFTTGPGVTSVTVQAWGGGGGGADDAGMMGNAGGGGGGGAFRTATVSVLECTSYGIVVGGGGAGGASSMMGMGDNDGDPGGVSSFGGTLFTVNGGAGADGSVGGAGGAAGTFAGGMGANASGDNGGGGGGSAGGGGAGGNAAGQTGGAAGLGSPTGAVGGMGGSNMSDGSAGSFPGGGGGGAGDMGMSGGAGASGRVIVIVP
jgi:hypothetical protein